MTALVSPSSAIDSTKAQAAPTLWGLGLQGLHDRYWASRGIQVVRLGEPSAIVPHVELFLLTDARTLVIFRPAAILDRMHWLKPDLVTLRLVDRRTRGYTERVEADERGRLKRFSRVYEGTDPHIGRVALTTDPEVARLWQANDAPRAGWRRLRRLVEPQARFATRLEARVFDSTRESDKEVFIRELIRAWQRPDATIDGVRADRPRVWIDSAGTIQPGAIVRGPIWIGAGRTLGQNDIAVGPDVLWDEPSARPEPPPIQWQNIEPQGIPPAPPPGRIRRGKPRPMKRIFDVVFALLAIAATLPLYPIVAILIAIEDGFPIFFGHERESVGGRTFKCWKFRSMRKDAEKLKAELAAQNKADGPQFFIPNDPRLTRVGRVIRDLQIDELPQFFNVLTGDMSIVGPRPSPFKENQYCPPWREARLSVRPGITGLWQISRTRAEGADFQEWIRYDIQYVERQSLLLDVWIIWRTLLLVIRKATIA